ncbi:sigma-70 family RNA polymerase sigma factor [soil metagenome]
MTSDDHDLISRIRAGDDTAFDAVIDRHADHVYAICLRYFGNPHDAEDASQAAFLACYRGLAGFRGRAALSTWLYRVTTNACHDLARRRSRQPQTVPLDDRRDGGDEPFDQAALDRLAAAELQPQLLDALAQLDDDQRRAVVLRDVVGASYAEIAEAQAVAVGTAKSRVHRAHARLAEILRPAGNQSARTGTPTVQDDK